MTTKRYWRPEVESLEERTVLSAGLRLAPVALAPAAHHGHHARHVLALDGSVSGTWQKRFTLPDTGGDQVLTGSGAVAPLGPVRMSGELHTPGFISQGNTRGMVTLTNAKGSVTVQLVGPPQPGFSGPPSMFRYTIVGGTGRYAGASGSGRATFEEQPAHGPVCPPNTVCPTILEAATFTLTFVPRSSVLVV
jgi:hypothetical protein